MKKILSNAVTVFVLVIVLLLIIPLSPFLMDILIIINIAVSMVVLIISMNIREPRRPKKCMGLTPKRLVNQRFARSR